jgi:hypothetical protein
MTLPEPLRAPAARAAEPTGKQVVRRLLGPAYPRLAAAVRQRTERQGERHRITHLEEALRELQAEGTTTEVLRAEVAALHRRVQELESRATAPEQP